LKFKDGSIAREQATDLEWGLTHYGLAVTHTFTLPNRDCEVVAAGILLGPFWVWDRFRGVPFTFPRRRKWSKPTGSAPNTVVVTLTLPHDMAKDAERDQ